MSVSSASDFPDLYRVNVLGQFDVRPEADEGECVSTAEKQTSSSQHFLPESGSSNLGIASLVTIEGSDKAATCLKI